jgi:hypothetical protein
VSDLSPELLPVEYQAALAHLQRIEDRLLLSSVVGLLISVAAAAHALGSRADLNPGYAWAAPVPFLASAAVLLALFAWWLAARARVNNLRRLAGLPAPPASPRTSFLHSLLALPAVGWLVLYGLTLLYSLRAVYTTSRAAGTTFGVVFVLLNVALALAGLAVWRLWREKTPLTAGEVRQVLLPYPEDLLAGMVLFSAGFVVPLLTMGLNASQLPVLNALFRRDIDFTTSVPLAAETALGLAYFLVIEFLLFPVVRLWRQVRHAAPAPAQIFIYTQLIVRLALALGLAFLLGGPALLVLAALILLQQAVDQWTAPIPGGSGAPARARFNLLWGGLLAPLRFYAGALAWVGPAWTFTLLLLLACTVAFLSAGLRAARRARQARIQVVRGLKAAPYDLESVPRWQRAAFLAAGLTTVGLVAFQVLAEDCGFFNTLLASYGRCKDGLVIYRQTSPLNALLLTFDLPLLGLLVCAGIVRWLERAGTPLMMFTVRVRTAGIFVLLAATVGLGVAGLAGELPVLALGGLLTGTAGTALWAER